MTFEFRRQPKTLTWPNDTFDANCVHTAASHGFLFLRYEGLHTKAAAKFITSNTFLLAFAGAPRTPKATKKFTFLLKSQNLFRLAQLHIFIHILDMV